MTDIEPSKPKWRSALPPELRTKHVHSWCPFCYLGWKSTAQRCCDIALPLGNADCHVPAIDFDRESPLRKIMGMFHPRPWEARQMLAVGVNLATQRREVPGLARELAIDRRVRAKLADPRNVGMGRSEARMLVLASGQVDDLL